MSWNAVLPGVLLLGLVIFVHELGHFLMAKWRGVRVLRFSLGFGPKLWGFTRGETEYMLAWFPLGGYVQMAGDTVEEDGRMPGSREEFLSHPWIGRLWIALAGPGANLITAFVVLVTVGMIGVTYSDYPNRLGATPDTSLVHRHGLREGDAIVSVAGQPTRSWVEIFVRNSKTDRKQPVEIVADRSGKRVAFQLDPAEREPFFSSLRRPADPPLVGSVVTGMPAYKAGFREGDRILAVDGKAIRTWEDLPPSLVDKVDRRVKIRVRRGEKEFDVAVTPMDPEGRGSRNGRIGIEPPRYGVYVERHGIFESVEIGARATAALVGSVYGGMWLTLSRPLYYREYIGGPLFIAQAASQQARRGVDAYLQFLAMINIAIMAFNLLPLPMLDGGHMLLAVLEGLRRKGISAQAYVRFQKAGLVVLGALLVLILANDPLRMIQRQRAIDRHSTTSETAPPTTAPAERPAVPASP